MRTVLSNAHKCANTRFIVQYRSAKCAKYFEAKDNKLYHKEELYSVQYSVHKLYLLSISFDNLNEHIITSTTYIYNTAQMFAVSYA